MNKRTVISVLGCGWLGFPLAQQLAENGFFVRGSTTSTEKLKSLSEKNIDPFLVQFNPHYTSGRGKEFFNCDIIIVTIPPKKEYDLFLLQMQELSKIILEYRIPNTIFISSTGVYGDINTEVDEYSIPRPDTISGKSMLAAEELFLGKAFQTTIIRFGGLIGPGRHPGRFFSGKKDIPNGKAPVNLIHLDDCIGIIEKVIQKDSWNKIYNACAPQHPSRKDFYTAAAADAGLPLPEFKDELQKWKIVKSRNTPEFLNYQFKCDLKKLFKAREK